MPSSTSRICGLCRASLGESARAIAADLPQRLKVVQALILEELAVRQGDRGGINYIDPRPLIEHLSVPADNLSLGEIDVSETEADYPDISRLANSKWATLHEVLKEEHDALSKLTYSIEPLLRSWYLQTDSIQDALREFLESARAVIKACETANQSLGDDALQTQIRNLAPTEVSRHTSAIERAIQVLEDEPLAVLTLDISKVNDTVNFVTRIHKAIQGLQQSLSQRLSEVVTAEEVEAARQGSVTAIKELLTLGTEEPITAEAKV